MGVAGHVNRERTVSQSKDKPLSSREKNRNHVGISLMVSQDTEAIVEVTRATYPDATIDFRDCYYKIERDGELKWSMDAIGDVIGKKYDTDLFLVNMSTYYGRINVQEGEIAISAEIAPQRFRQ
jgi:propane monooxygenase coupling protein